MSDRHKGQRHAYAVVRLDLGEDGKIDGDPYDAANGVTVKEILSSIELAEAEVARLNKLNASKGCHYFWQTTRLYPEGLSAGTEPDFE